MSTEQHRENEGEWRVVELTITAGSGGGFAVQRCLQRDYDLVTTELSDDPMLELEDTTREETHRSDQYDDDATNHYFTSQADLVTWLKDNDALEALIAGCQA